ncbi:MAG: c-type cytochrome [Fimbriiglobus sp.]
MKRFWLALAGAALMMGGLCLIPAVSAQQEKAKDKEKSKGKAKEKSTVPAKPQFATPAKTLKVAKGFEVDLVYSVPKESEGSWVNLCVDPKGRLITSDQYGALYRITLSEPAKIEKIPIELGMAQGLLCAFDALYVVVNAGGDKAGLYKVTDANNDDQYDKVELLRKFEGAGGEHGCHAVIPHPDGKRLTIVCGNQTKMTKFDTTKVPPIWGDDHLLPRVPDGNGFMKGVLAPGGYMVNVDPDGKNWELVSIGFRNQYDAAYNASGDLFSYDADMEWDFNTPWYRPTRVCHVVPGSDWGWRNGAGKYPEYYPDNLPPTVNIGPGSPTGVCFGYGAKFPKKYQNAFFICDWSYGKLYAVHHTLHGATYKGVAEEFISGTPLPLTDVVINPMDGHMYFAIGGRKTQSGLYRVRYTGSESTAPAIEKPAPNDAQMKRLELEQYLGNGKTPEAAIVAAWPHLNSDDRFLRSTARTVIESQGVATWESAMYLDKDPVAKTQALLAYARKLSPCPLHDPKAKMPTINEDVAKAVLDIDLSKLSTSEKIDYFRMLQVLLHRQNAAQDLQSKLLKKFDGSFPTGSRYVDSEMLPVLVSLKSATVGAKGVKLMIEAPTQEEQIEYARSLRMLTVGWTPELRKDYFGWFVKAGGYKGGNSFQGFLRLIKDDAVKLLSEAEIAALKPILEAKPASNSVVTAPPRAFVKKWTLDDLTPVVEKGLAAGKRDFDKGRKLFAAANCFACHRYDNEGGSNGPDLSGVAGRFGTRDLLESIIDPSKEVSDQYGAVQVVTLDGKVITGRIVNLNGDDIKINTDMLNPNGQVSVNRNNIDEMKPSKLSMMPTGLFDTFNAEELVDIMAYLLSRGDRDHKYFKK